MRKQRIKKLKYYKELLLECKRIQLYYQLSEEVENRFPSNEKSKQKTLSLFK